MKPWSKLHKDQQDMGVCPRCEGLIPSNQDHGKYMGAVSRLTRGQDAHQPIEVCSACGNEEGMQEHFEGFATPVADWPIMTREGILRRSQAFDILMAYTDKEDSDDDGEF